MIFNNMSEGTSIDAKSTSSNLHDAAESELRRGPWTLEEDNLLIQYISCHGEGRWNSSAKCAGLKRTGKSCRLRWLNYLKPDIKRGNLTPHEQLLILELHSKWGNRWSRIAQHLPGRTDNEIKNYWRTRVQKQARQLKVDSNSKKFLEAIRTFWIPRLMEKMDQQNQDSPSPTSSSPSYNSSISTQFAAAAPSSPVICEQAPLPSTSLVNNHNSDNKNSSIPQHLVPDCILPSFSSCGEIDCEDTFDDHHYYVGSISPSTYGMREEDISVSGHHVAEADWFGDDPGSCFWNTDELWQFRKSGEIGV